jgi:sugar phosphate permease
MNRCVILFLTWLALLLSFIDRLVWSSMAPSVGASLTLPLSALGIFASAFFSGYVLSNLIGGITSDRFGARIALGSALIMLGIFTFGFSFTSSVTTGVMFQLLMGLTAGADYSACVKVITAWFPPLRRARAMGILMTSLPIGVVIVNSVIPRVLPYMPWPFVYRDLGVATLCFGTMLLFLLRDAPPAAKIRLVSRLDILALLRNPELGRLALVGFGAAWGTWGFVFWATALMSRGHGLTAVQAGLATTLFGAAAIVAKPVTGAVSDWMGGRRKPLIIAVLLVYTTGLLIFGQLQTPVQFAVAATLLGFFGFSWGPLLSTLVAEVGGGETAGTTTGLTNALWQLGGVTVPVAIGFVFGHTHVFAYAFGAMAVGPGLASIVMWLFCHEASYARV